MQVGLRRSRTAASRETLVAMRDTIAMQTAGLVPGGLKADLDRLSEDEQHKVIELVGVAGAGGAWSWDKLSKKQRTTLEDLVEQAADKPRFFADARSVAEIQALAASAHRESVRKRLTRKEEHGVFEAIAVGIEARSLDAADVALIAVIVTAYVSGRATAPRTRIERVGELPALVVEDANMGGPYAASFDEEQQLAPRWKQNLQWLEEAHWFEVERQGKQLTILPGSRLRVAMAGEKRAA
jgi:DNA-binding Lrp family transcriptional regulator